MFVRKLGNPSEGPYIQAMQKIRGRYKIAETVGCATTKREIETLSNLAKQEIEKLSLQPILFESDVDVVVNRVLSSLSIYTGFKVQAFI